MTKNFENLDVWVRSKALAVESVVPVLPVKTGDFETRSLVVLCQFLLILQRELSGMDGRNSFSFWVSPRVRSGN